MWESLLFYNARANVGVDVNVLVLVLLVAVLQIEGELQGNKSSALAHFAIAIGRLPVKFTCTHPLAAAICASDVGTGEGKCVAWLGERNLRTKVCAFVAVALSQFAEGAVAIYHKRKWICKVFRAGKAIRVRE